MFGTIELVKIVSNISFGVTRESVLLLTSTVRVNRLRTCCLSHKGCGSGETHITQIQEMTLQWSFSFIYL